MRKRDVLPIVCTPAALEKLENIRMVDDQAWTIIVNDLMEHYRHGEIPEQSVNEYGIAKAWFEIKDKRRQYRYMKIARQVI